MPFLRKKFVYENTQTVELVYGIASFLERRMREREREGESCTSFKDQWIQWSSLLNSSSEK